MLKAKSETPSLRHSLLTSYLLCNWVPDPDTLFDGIQRLEPGHFLTLNPGAAPKKSRYWDLSFAADETKSLRQWSDALSARLDSAVARQIRSDVPVGFFLSGGVDSSLLAAKAAQSASVKPSTFTIGFRWTRSAPGSSHDNLDLECARLLKDQFPFDYHELILDPSIVSVLPKVVACLEEPVADPAALCSYLICEAASKRFTVMISGQGGDELFGGYAVYPAGRLAAGMQRLPGSILSLFSRASGHLPYSIAGRRMQLTHRVKKMMSMVGRPWPEPFLLLRSAMRADEAQALLTPQALEGESRPCAGSSIFLKM